MIENLRYLFVYLAVTSLIFFIVNNAINTANFKRKAFVFFLTGLFLLLAMFIAHLIDRYYFKIEKFPFNYYAFPIAVLIVTAISVSIYFYKGHKYHHQLRMYKVLKPNHNDFLYIVYQYQNNYYLDMKQNNYCGDIVKFARNVHFHNQMINIRTEQLFLDVNKINYIGKISAREKKKDFIFYCYLVELASDNNLDRFKKVNQFEIQNIETLDFHKNIILRILIKEEFYIKL